jgi:glucosamine-phosphate N-acetyltransferase
MNFLIRKLLESDYEKYRVLINGFRPTEFTQAEFINTLTKINKQSDIWIIENDREFMATGTILYESKFIHNISIYAHIEDMYVDETYRKHGIGKLLVEHLVYEAKSKKCYKVILDCNESLESFYKKNNFNKNGIQMVIYTDTFSSGV